MLIRAMVEVAIRSQQMNHKNPTVMGMGSGKKI